jgi:Ni,Fe-hydrogenase III large subunit/Ni,Fe-hydrogenase III component G
MNITLPNTPDAVDAVRTALGDLVLHTRPLGVQRVGFEVRPSDLPTAASTVQRVCGGTLVNLVGVDDRPRDGVFRVHLIFALQSARRFVTLTACLDPKRPAYPSVAGEVHAVDWYERENYDLLGIVPEGHPVLTHMILHFDWPDGVFPLRKDYPQRGPWPRRVSGREPPPRATGPGVFQYPLGPLHYGIAESSRFIISSLGEEIADVTTRLFYKHRGIEKRCEGVPLTTVNLFAERIAANSAVTHSLAFARAVEDATAVHVSSRANLIRVILAELERLYNHVGDIAGLAEATGLSVGYAQGAILAEQLKRLNVHVTGHRYLFGAIVPGGVAIDLNPSVLVQVQQTLRDFERAFRSYTKDLLASTSFLDRLEETGVVMREVALDHALVGPVARASGVDTDMRRDYPYGAYSDVAFHVPVYERGDALARMRVRIDEVFESISIVQQACGLLRLATSSQEPLRVPIPPLSPGSEGMGYIEGPRGGVVHWLSADESGTLYRYKIRPASFVNWHVFHLAAAGNNILTDFPIIDRSFALLLASNDR